MRLDDTGGQFQDISYHVNMALMSVDLTVAPYLFKKSRYNVRRNVIVHPTRPPPGGYLNYDLNGQTLSDQSQLGGLFDASLFNGKGVTDNNFLLQHNFDHSNSNDQNNSADDQAIRLNSSWINDNPEKMQTLRLGDSYNMPGLWGRSVDFGGIQWGTNFATQPGFVTFPMPSIRGEAVVPNIADLYVNNALVSNNAIAPGFFNYDSIPVMTGQGTVSLITKDALGRQQMISVPYYASNSLLRPGLKDYSYEAGFIRQNYGIQSNDYDQFMVTGTNRLGLSPSLTGELHEEIMKQEQTLGIGGSSLVSTFGIVNLAIASSRSNRGMGGLALLGFEHQVLRGINFGFNTEITTNHFAEVGYTDGDESPPALQNQSFLGFVLPDRSSLAFSYIQEDNRQQSNVNFLNGSYTKTLKSWTVNFSGIKSLGGYKQNGLFLTLTHALGHQTTVNLGGSEQNNSSEALAQISKTLPVGNGYGYSLATGNGNQQMYQASGSAQYTTGTYMASMDRENDQTNYGAEARGSIAELDGKIYLTHQIDDSFGVAELPYANIPVYENNQLLGTTDKKGAILLPNLLPYQENKISVNPNDLPLEAEIKASESTAIPYYHSGVIVHLPIQSAHAAIMHLIQINGEFVPEGAEVTSIDSDLSFPVTDQGEVYISSLKPNNNFTVNWDNHVCHFQVQYTQTLNPLPDLGKMICL